MTYEDIIAQIGENGHIINNDVVLESVILEEDVNGDGGLSVRWNSLSNDGIQVGTMLEGYVLMKSYLPNANGDGSYTYDVKFSDPVALLGKRLFYKTVQTIDKLGNIETTPLYTFEFVGFPQTIITHLATVSGYECDTENLPNAQAIIGVSFDGDTIKSAAQKIADACGVVLWFTPNVIHFGSPVGALTDEYYNYFIVLGGTKNMAKKVTTSQGDEYAAITQRLSLPAGLYNGTTVEAGSVICSEHGRPRMEKMLIFDNIYPKARFKIKDVAERRCWILDENGERIETDSTDACAVRDTAENKYFKTYSKWYIELEDVDGSHIDQSHLEQLIIDGTVLRMQFLPFDESKEGYSGGVLAGRDFELVHFTEDTEEWEEDDVLDQTHKFKALAGWYRIIFNADGSTIIPSTSGQMLVPQVGNIVSLINIAMPEESFDAARQELLQAALTAIAMYYDDVPTSYTEECWPANELTPSGFVPGSSEHYNVTLGQHFGDYIVTSIQTDLITQKKTITFSNLAQKGVLSSVVDKVEGPQVSGGKGTENNPTHDTLTIGTISAEQWKSLQQAGGNRGIVTIKNQMGGITDTLAGLDVDVTEIKSQTDEQMKIIFGMTAPHPSSQLDTTTNYPASEWNTVTLRKLHVGDLYYDYSREAADPNGGRAWKWTEHSLGSINIDTGQAEVGYWWNEVTDADTIASLEKIADVAYDGKLSGGSEKSRVYTEWLQAVEDHRSLSTLVANTDLTQDFNDYDEWYDNLSLMLNGGSTADITAVRDGSKTPAWLQDLSTTTSIIFPASFLEDIYGTSFDAEEDDIEAFSREAYRLVWNNYYEQKILLEQAFKRRGNVAYQKVEDIADDGIISAGTEKSQLLQLWQETVAEFWKYIDLAEDHGMEQQSDTTSGGVTTRSPYREYAYQFMAVARMLNNQDPSVLDDTRSVYNFDMMFSHPSMSDKTLLRNVALYLGTTVPVWIGTDYGTDTKLSTTPIGNAAAYRERWNSYYVARAALIKGIESATKSIADTARTTAEEVKSFIESITGDGQLTVDEIPGLKREFETLYRQRAEMVKLATDNTTHKLIDTSLHGDVTAFLNAFTALANYLNKNQGTWTASGETYVINNADNASQATYNVAAKVPLGNGDWPTLLLIEQAIVFVEDWTADPLVPDKGATFCKLWADALTAQTALANAVSTLTKGIADEALGDASTAIGKLNDMASDSKLDPTEKLEVKKEFRSIWFEKDSGSDNLTTRWTAAGLDATHPAWTAYQNAFANLAKYLNGGTAWQYATTFIGAAERTDDKYPSWLQSGNITTTNTINGDTWRSLWTTFYYNRTAVLTTLSKVAKDAADEALAKLGDIADDAKITEQEKSDLLSQWRVWANEYQTRKTASELPTISASTEWTAYHDAFHNFGNFLEDPSSYQAGREITLHQGEETIADFTPAMLAASGTSSLTSAQTETYKELFITFLTAREKLTIAFSTGQLTYWMSAFLPSEGFFFADRCLWLNHLPNGDYESGTNTIMFCIKDHDSEYSYNPDSQGTPSYNDTWANYWKEASSVIQEIEKDPRRALAELADILYGSFGKATGNFPITVAVGASPSVTPNGKSSITLSNYPNINSLLIQLRVLIGEATFTVRLDKQDTSKNYNLCCSPVNCLIPGSSETVTGGVQISMYYDGAWEYLQESTSSLLESLGNKILAMVFGSNAAATEAAGLDVGQRFAKLFASAQVYDEETNQYKTLAEALLGLSVEPRYKNINNNNIISAAEYESLSASEKAKYKLHDYVSSAKISADRIDLQASNLIDMLTGHADDLARIGLVIKKDGENGSIQLGTFVGNKFRGVTIDSSGFVTNVEIDADSLNIDVSKLKIKAEDVNFKTGNFSIKDDSDNETFGIGADGKVRMNEAVVRGDIIAKSLALQEKAEIPNLIAQQVLSRNEESKVYTSMAGGDFQIGTYTEDAQDSEGSKEKHYTPLYSIVLVTRDNRTYPVIRMQDSEGNTIGVIDKELFENVVTVPDTWTEKYLLPHSNPSWANSGTVTGYKYYQYNAGYTMSGGTKTQTQDQMTFDKKWLSSMSSLNTSYLLNGTFVVCETKYHFNALRTKYYLSRDVWHISNGEVTSTDVIRSEWIAIEGGEEIDPNS